MKVTVIMPIYNGAKYIKDAINSLLAQTNNNWELICIDDGSTDNSKEIIEYYVKCYSNIQIITQVNSGPGVARANAIKNVTTDYIAILDSDDAYAPNYIELMLKKAEETNADVIVPNVEFELGNQSNSISVFERNNLTPNMIIKDGVKAFSMTFPWKLHGWQMIKTDLAKKYYTIENASYSKFNSDEYITRLIYLKSKIVALCDAKYYYRIDSNSLTRKISLKQFDYLKTLDKLIKLGLKEKINKRIIIDIFNDYFATLRKMYKHIKQLDDKDKKQAKELVTYYYNNSYKKFLTLDIIKSANYKTRTKFIISKISFLIFKI